MAVSLHVDFGIQTMVPWQSVQCSKPLLKFLFNEESMKTFLLSTLYPACSLPPFWSTSPITTPTYPLHFPYEWMVAP